jgi:hypothetical protein
MYILNHLNLLYFHPHKLHFSPVTDVANSDCHTQRFSGHSVWAAPSLATPLSLFGQDDGALKFGQVESAKDRDRIDSDRMDDDGSPNATRSSS